jgi:hypothetical protein
VNDNTVATPPTMPTTGSTTLSQVETLRACTTSSEILPSAPAVISRFFGTINLPSSENWRLLSWKSLRLSNFWPAASMYLMPSSVLTA